MKQTHTVQEEYKDLRLDVYLSNAIAQVPSRVFIKKMIEAGQVKVNGRQEKVRYKVVAGDHIEADIDEEAFAPKDVPAEKMELNIFYEDENLAVINKPAGLTVHPASGSQSGTLVNGLMYRYKELSDINGTVRPGIVHRLDRDTSGLILIAKTNVAHARLGRQFEKHTIIKRYVARVQGKVEFDQGVIDVPLERHKKYHDQRQVAKEGGGKPAITMYQVLKRYPQFNLGGTLPSNRAHASAACAYETFGASDFRG